MKYEKIIVDGEELEIVISISPEYKDDNIIKNLDDTLELINLSKEIEIMVENYE